MVLGAGGCSYTSRTDTVVVFGSRYFVLLLVGSVISDLVKGPACAWRSSLGGSPLRCCGRLVGLCWNVMMTMTMISFYPCNL